jgi:hypothetical protein
MTRAQSIAASEYEWREGSVDSGRVQFDVTVPPRIELRERGAKILAEARVARARSSQTRAHSRELRARLAAVAERSSWKDGDRPLHP